MSASGDNDGSASGDVEIDRLLAENESLRSALSRRYRWRRVLAILLVVLTSLSVVVASLAVWVHQVVFDTDRFMETVDPALTNPDVYELVGDRASESVLDALDLETRVTDVLTTLDEYLSEVLVDALDPSDRARAILDRFDRPTLAALAPSITAGLEERIDGRIHAFFSSEAFASRLPGLVARAHEATVALARDDLAELPNVYVEGGEVRLNLIPFIAEALQRVGDDIRAALPDFELPDIISDRVDEGRSQIEAAVQSRLPEDFGQITVMSEASLSEIQDVVVLLDRSVWIAVLTAVLLLILTIAVSPNRRATTVHLGIGVLVGIVVAALAVRRVESTIVDQIVDPRGAGVAAEVVGGALSGLRLVELLIALAAIVVAIVAYLAGRPAWYARLSDSARVWTERENGASRLDVWVGVHAGLLRMAGVAVALVVVFIFGLDLILFIIVGVLLALYLWLISAASRRIGPVGAVGGDGVGLPD